MRREGSRRRGAAPDARSQPEQWISTLGAMTLSFALRSGPVPAHFVLEGLGRSRTCRLGSSCLVFSTIDEEVSRSRERRDWSWSQVFHLRRVPLVALLVMVAPFVGALNIKEGS